MKSLGQIRQHLASTRSVLTNFPRLTIDAEHQIQYTFDRSTRLCQTTHLLHQPSNDEQQADLPTLLILHGTLGGIDSARWHARGLSQYRPASQQEKVYQILSISRPGYLSSQPEYRSFSHEASILDAICEQLKLKQITVMAVSGSGPSALTFVRDFPHRVKGELTTTYSLFHSYLFDSGLILMDTIAKYVSFNAFDSGLMTFLWAQNFTSNLLSSLWQKSWRPEQMQRFGFSGPDVVEEIRSDPTVESMYRDYFLPTFTWGGYRRVGFRSELEHLKRNLPQDPQWKIRVPVLYLYGGEDRWIDEEHVRCVMNNVREGVAKKVVKFPRAKHLLPVKQSSLVVNDFLWKHVF